MNLDYISHQPKKYEDFAYNRVYDTLNVKGQFA